MVQNILNCSKQRYRLTEKGRRWLADRMALNLFSDN